MAPKRHQNTVRYLNDTACFLLAPIASIKVLRGNLTTIYLQQHHNLNLVMKVLYHTFREASSIAKSNLGLDYALNREKIRNNPAKYYVQGINLTTLDIIVDGLIENESVISLSRFYEKFGMIWEKRVPRKGELVLWSVMCPLDIQVVELSPPLPLCIVRLCLVALYFLVKCSEHVGQTYVSRPIFSQKP